MNATVLKRLNELEDKIDLLLRLSGREHWLTASEVTRLTGWDRHTLARKRGDDTIVYRTNKNNGFIYLYESIAPCHLINDKRVPDTALYAAS